MSRPRCASCLRWDRSRGSGLRRPCTLRERRQPGAGRVRTWTSDGYGCDDHAAEPQAAEPADLHRAQLAALGDWRGD